MARTLEELEAQFTVERLVALRDKLPAETFPHARDEINILIKKKLDALLKH